MNRAHHSAVLMLPLERYPWATLTDDKGNLREIHYTPSEAVEWHVNTAADRLPGPFDVDVYVAICHLFNRAVMERPKEERWENLSGTVSFGFRELADVMRRSAGGTLYDSLQAAIRRLKAVEITSRVLFPEGPMKEKELGISILIDRELTTYRTRTQSDAKYAEVVLHPRIVRQLAARKFRLLDVDTYFRLDRPTTKRLYRYLDYRSRSRKQATLRLPVRVLAGELPLSRNAPSQVAIALAAAHRELVKIGFLAGEPVFDKRTYAEPYVIYPVAPAKEPEPESGAAGTTWLTTDPDYMRERTEALVEIFGDEAHRAVYAKAVKVIGAYSDQVMDRYVAEAREYVELCRGDRAKARKQWTKRVYSEHAELFALHDALPG